MNLYGIAFKAIGALGEPVIVVRRDGLVDNNGRTDQYSAVARYHIWAQVTPVTPGSVLRDPDRQYTIGTIEVNTDFMLRGPASDPDVLSDEIWWKGQSYLITNIQMYSKNGVGFVTAICELMTQHSRLVAGVRPHSLAEEDAIQPPAE